MTISDPLGVSNDPSYAGLRVTVPVIATAAITAGDLVALTMAADGELRGTSYATGTHSTTAKAAVALDTATGANDIIMVVVWGPVLINIGTGAVAIGEQIIPTATAGVADGVAADATAVVGSSHGVFLTDEVGTSNQAWGWVR